MTGWIGVDLDGTLAEYLVWTGGIGQPIPAMQQRVILWLQQGKDVRIFTARADDPGPGELNNIRTWCQMHLGAILPITCKKDRAMIELWDDRAVQVIPNTGRRADGRLD